MPASISNISTVANAETGTNGYKPGNLVQLVHSGSEYFDLLSHLIKTAKNEIHLQYYIFNDDQAGKLIADLLVKAAARKVQVYLLLDGFESRSLSNEFIESLAVPNLHLQFFEPLLRSKHFYIGRRLHHKIAVFDQRIAIIGGINIADRYLGSQSYPAWLDLAIRIEGPIVADIYDVCRVYW